MKLKIKNMYLVPAHNFMSEMKLKGADSRARSKLLKLIKTAVESLGESERELIEEYGEKDTDGKLIEDGGSYRIPAESRTAYVKEYKKLMEEVAEIAGGTYVDHIDKLERILSDCDMELEGVNAEVYDILLDALEGAEKE